MTTVGDDGEMGEVRKEERVKVERGGREEWGKA